METSKNQDIERERELTVKEIIEIDGDVEISRDGEYLIIQSIDTNCLTKF